MTHDRLRVDHGMRTANNAQNKQHKKVLFVLTRPRRTDSSTEIVVVLVDQWYVQ